MGYLWTSVIWGDSKFGATFPKMASLASDSPKIAKLLGLESLDQNTSSDALA
jgi:hypothetical protein